MNSTDEEFRNSPTFTTTRKQRTKRQRTTTSCYPGGGGGCADNSSSSSASATPKSATYNDSEDEDVASCLILLANGVHKSKTPKISNGVYECKTCNKTFPSFQALGGHRTSHKKLVVVDKSADHNSSPIMNSEIINRVLDEKTTRVHECSICGSEFPSGQALGGHMRRHRPIGVPPPSSEVDEEVKNTVLELDLNLPAAPEDNNSHMVETKFHVLPTPPLLLDCHY